MSIFLRPHGYPYLRRPMERDRAIGPYDYISCGETLKKVGCSIGSAWVGAGAIFNERAYGEVWEIQGQVDGHKISFSLGA